MDTWSIYERSKHDGKIIAGVVSGGVMGKASEAICFHAKDHARPMLEGLQRKWPERHFSIELSPGG